MEDLNVVDSINHAGTWLARNRGAAAELCRQHRRGYRYPDRRDDRGARRL